MSRCNAENSDYGDIVVCTKSKNHTGDHHAYDAETDISWTDEIDELAPYTNRSV